MQSDGNVPAGLLDRVKADAAMKAGVRPDQVRVVSVAPVDWGDTSLGCPQPGQMYSQIVTPGYRLTLDAGGRRLEYHSDRASRFVTC